MVTKSNSRDLELITVYNFGQTYLMHGRDVRPKIYFFNY